MGFNKLLLTAIFSLGWYGVANAAEITLKEEHYIRAGYDMFIGHEHDRQDFEIRINSGDNLTKIVQQLNERGLQSKVVCGKENPATVSDLIKQNPKITNLNLIYAGDTLQYSRVSYIRPGVIAQF